MQIFEDKNVSQYLTYKPKVLQKTFTDVYHNYIFYYFIVHEQMKVLRSLNNTTYLVTGVFD